MRRGGFPRNPKCLFSNWIWMRSSNLSSRKWVRERYFPSSHIWPQPEVPQQEKRVFQPATFFLPQKPLCCTARMPRSKFLLGLACFLNLVFFLPDLLWLSGSCYCFIVTGELQPLPDLWWICLSMSRYMGDILIRECPWPMTRWHLYCPADQFLIFFFFSIYAIKTCRGIKLIYEPP